tara:strand:- start:94 stop:501 length:408 start_codon:yes stop_codon:yes gene_type:complete
MPIYKAFILNKEINVNYEENQKDKLVEAVKAINSKLASYGNQDGKISDSKLLSFLSIKLQAELFDLSQKKQKDIIIEKKFKDSNIENISLNDKLYKLRQENQLLKKENDLINHELIKIESQLEVIMGLLKKMYEE